MAWEVDAFARSLTSVSDATVRAYESDVIAFVEWAERGGTSEPAGVDRMLLRRYLAFLSTRQYARRSIARKAAALRRYFKWLHRTGALAADPAVRLQAPARGGRLPHVLSRAEVAVLLDEPPAAIDGDAEPIRLRDDAVLELLYGSGLRVAELSGLTLGDVDLPGRRVTVWGKGSKQRQ